MNLPTSCRSFFFRANLSGNIMNMKYSHQYRTVPYVSGPGDLYVRMEYIGTATTCINSTSAQCSVFIAGTRYAVPQVCTRYCCNSYLSLLLLCCDCCCCCTLLLMLYIGAALYNAELLLTFPDSDLYVRLNRIHMNCHKL